MFSGSLVPGTVGDFVLARVQVDLGSGDVHDLGVVAGVLLQLRDRRHRHTLKQFLNFGALYSTIKNRLQDQQF